MSEIDKQILGGDVLLFPKPLIVTEEFGGPGRGGVKMTFTWKTRLHSLSPDPPATLESFTIPNEGGSARKTEYTEGLPEPEGTLVARLRTKMAPRHCELPGKIWSRFMSVTFIGHALPPKLYSTLFHAQSWATSLKGRTTDAG